MARKIQPKNKTPVPKPGQSSEDYWRERETRQRAANIHDEARYAARINDIFQSTQDSIQQEIESFYQRYAKKEEIDISEARRRVSKIDMEKYERLAAQYVKAAHEGGREAAFSDEANEQMRLYNATMRINRLEMLKARCGIRAMEGYRLTDQLINEALEERVYSEYYRLAGILGNTVQFNENLVRSIVNSSYQNATWSQRLWNNQALLSERIGAQIAQGILTGKGSDVLAQNIQKLTGQSTYVCQRLMRTELRRVQTAAAEQSMLDNGVTEYKFMVANGVNPCDECLALDGKVFKISEMSVGKNAPPKHPLCHCCTAPYVDEAKWQRWLESGMKVPWSEFESKISSSEDRESDKESKFKNILDEARRKLRASEEGAKIVSFKDLNSEDIKSFQNGLRRADPLIRESLKRQFKNSDYQLHYYKTECYQEEGKRPVIRLLDGFTSETLAHELFHSMDEMGRLSKTMGTSLYQDWLDLRIKAGAYGGVVSYLQKEFPDSFKSDMLFPVGKLKEEYRGISDIIHGLSMGAINLGYGHDELYWNDSGTAEMEAWAQFGRIYYANNPNARKMFSTLFPNFEKDAVRKARGL